MHLLLTSPKPGTPVLILYDTDLYCLPQVLSINLEDKEVFLLLS